MRSKYLILVVLILVLVPSLLGLLAPGFFESDDGEWMVIRFSAFYQALADGQFPVRFLDRLNFGYGYPVANFLYPGFMYLATPFKLLGLSFVSSVEAILILSMLGGGIFTFKWLSRLFGEKESLVGATFYTYAPYHLYDLYKRGSVGEILALGVLPFILWQIERRSIFFIAFGVAFLVLSHNTLALIFLPFILLYMGISAFVSNDRKTLLIEYLGSVLLGLGMSSFFWLPAFLELGHTVFSSIEVSDWQNYFANLTLIGLSTVLITAVSIFLLVKKAEIRKHRLTVFMLVVALLSVFLSSSLSRFLWEIFPSTLVQFPFRFLALSIPAIAFLTAFSLSRLKKRSQLVLIGVFFVAIFYSAVGYLSPESKTNKPDSYYSTNEDTTTVRGEYMPILVKDKPEIRYENKVELSGGKGSISDLSVESKRIYFEALSPSESIATVNTVYYPGWKAYVNGSESEINFANPKGVMEIFLKEGENRVEIVFGETTQRNLADFLSLFSFAALILWTANSYLRNKKNEIR